MEQVAAVRCESYNMHEVYASVSQALQQLNFTVPSNKTILIKPNIMSQNVPDQHTVTHFSVLDALCKILRDNNCRIQIGESISFYQHGLTRKAFRVSHIEEVAASYGAELIPFEETRLVRVPTELEWLPALYLPQVLLDADMIINAGKLKTHSGMRLAGAIKNMFGCLPGGYKQRIHMWAENDFALADVFLEIHRILQPELSILDAVLSLDGGPSAIGRPVNTGRILAAPNAAALDVTACRIIGYSPTDIAALVQAKSRRMFGDFEEVEVLGDIAPVHFRHINKSPLKHEKKKDSLLVTDTYVALVIDHLLCTDCDICVKNCPVEAISPHLGCPSISQERCINCYNCLSVCPVKAVKIKPSPLNQLIRAVRKLTGL